MFTEKMKEKILIIKQGMFIVFYIPFEWNTNYIPPGQVISTKNCLFSGGDQTVCIFSKAHMALRYEIPGIHEPT